MLRSHRIAAARATTLRTIKMRRAPLGTAATLLLTLVSLTPDVTLADTSIRDWMRAMAQQRDARYEACASVCQSQIDSALARCTGYREVVNPTDQSPPPPNCRRDAVENFERCMSGCPAPTSNSQG